MIPHEWHLRVKTQLRLESVPALAASLDVVPLLGGIAVGLLPPLPQRFHALQVKTQVPASAGAGDGVGLHRFLLGDVVLESTTLLGSGCFVCRPMSSCQQGLRMSRRQPRTRCGAPGRRPRRAVRLQLYGVWLWLVTAWVAILAARAAG
jgi:hypothetical protein